MRGSERVTWEGDNEGRHKQVAHGEDEVINRGLAPAENGAKAHGIG